MRPGKLNAWRWTRILAGYFLASLAIIVQANTPVLFSIERGNPLYLTSMKTGAWYPFFGAALIVLTLACVINLVRSARIAQASVLRKQLLIMASATLIAGLTGPVLSVGLAMGLPIPMVVISLLLAITVVVIGNGVVRYSAFMEGRTIQHDFYYSLMGMVLVVAVYELASWVLVLAYQAPAAILVLIPVLAVFTHALMPPVYRLMDRIFYRGEARQLRADLQRLARQAGEGGALGEHLGHALESLCDSVRASYGLILAYDQDIMQSMATYHWGGGELDLRAGALAADDVIHLAPGHFQPPLEEAALLVPLYAEAEQLGALVLGRPINGLRYADEEVEGLLAVTDRIGEMISLARHRAENLAQIARLAQAQSSPLAAYPLPTAERAVEAALRRLYDYAYLADTDLVDLQLVRNCLPQGRVTHLERGKAVHAILMEAIEKLRPELTSPHDPPPREWYPYLILQEAYVEEKPNRDIMSQLYISEGTFNRTRRGAIRSVARALGEMEAALP